jgi:Ni,Fe-hydrogenase III large subunit
LPVSILRAEVIGYDLYFGQAFRIREDGEFVIAAAITGSPSN